MIINTKFRYSVFSGLRLASSHFNHINTNNLMSNNMDSWDLLDTIHMDLDQNWNEDVSAMAETPALDDDRLWADEIEYEIVPKWCMCRPCLDLPEED